MLPHDTYLEDRSPYFPYFFLPATCLKSLLNFNTGFNTSFDRLRYVQQVNSLIYACKKKSGTNMNTPKRGEAGSALHRSPHHQTGGIALSFMSPQLIELLSRSVYHKNTMSQFKRSPTFCPLNWTVFEFSQQLKDVHQPPAACFVNSIFFKNQVVLTLLTLIQWNCSAVNHETFWLLLAAGTKSRTFFIQSSIMFP